MSYRIQRAQTLIMQEISLVILNDIKDPRVKNVTVTEVKLSADLRHAMVYYSVLGDEEAVTNAGKGLEHAASFIRKQLSKKIEMKFTPDLKFIYDDTLQKAAHIAELIELSKKHESQ